MDKEARLQAEEHIMDAVCALCCLPYFYRGKKVLYAEQCDRCPAAIAVNEVLDKFKTEE